MIKTAVIVIQKRFMFFLRHLREFTPPQNENIHLKIIQKRPLNIYETFETITECC